MNDNFDCKKVRMIRAKKIFSCTNCGKVGHTNRHCIDPVTSYGIIVIKIYLDHTIDAKQKISINDYDGINIDDPHDISRFSETKDLVKFLMIRRKHTLGYMEFVRGHYRTDNFDAIIFLFEQMTSEEIDKINNASCFDDIWNDLWNSTSHVGHEHEYEISKKKYDQLLEDEDILNLNYYVNNISPSYDAPEWGFPKGRRNFKETDIQCALREFQEETDIDPSFIKIMEGIDPVYEDFIGTNGIRYRHVYFLAMLDKDCNVSLNPDNVQQMNEIGDIGVFTYQESVQLIRPYHVERKKLVTKVYMMIQNRIIHEIITTSC